MATRLSISERMKEMMRYDKFSAPVPRMLVLESRYWLDLACINAARAMGWDVEAVPVVMGGTLPRENIAQLFTKLVEFKPDFILTINLSGMDVDGMFAGLFEDLGVPLVAWFADDPRTIIMGNTAYAASNAVALTWERAYIPYLEALGYRAVRHLPLAVDLALFNAPPTDAPPLPPAFVGNSMRRFARESWAYMEEHPQTGRAIREAFDAGRVSRSTFGLGFSELVRPEEYSGWTCEEQRQAELLFFIEGTRRLRHELAERLIPEGMALHGDDEWREVFPEAKESVHYQNELPAFYRDTAINLNITSIQMATAVNQRVFDCPAAGGFLLTDAQDDLNLLFDAGREIAVYTDMNDCVEKYRWFRTHPASAREIAANARERILGEHTYVQRLETIATLLRTLI